MALPIVVLGAFRFGRSRPRGAVLRRALAIAVVVFAMNATGSITALIAGATGLVAAGALNVFTLNTTVFRRFRNPLPVMLGILLALLLVVWVAASDLPVTERFGELGEDGSGPSASIDVRKELIAGVTDHFDQFLVTGRGLDSVVIIDGLPGEHRVHNLYLRLIYEAGIPALVGLGAILVTVVRQSWLLAIDTRASELNRVVVGLFGAFVSMLTFALFQPVLAQRFFWLPIALVGVVWALRRQELRDDASGHGAHDPRRVP
jgi:O-antigen ligase